MTAATLAIESPPPPASAEPGPSPADAVARLADRMLDLVARVHRLDAVLADLDDPDVAETRAILAAYRAGLAERAREAFHAFDRDWRDLRDEDRDAWRAISRDVQARTPDGGLYPWLEDCP